MAYDGKKGFNDFEREVGTYGRNLMQAVSSAEELYQDLLVFADGRDNATIAAALSVDVAWIDDLQAALVAFHRVHDFSENVAVTAGDHFDAIRKFT